MVGVVAAVLGVALLIYMCANITSEATERAVRRQYENWKHEE